MQELAEAHDARMPSHAHRFGRQANARRGTEREIFSAPSERFMERRVDRDDDAILPAGGQEADHAREIGTVDDLGRGPREHIGWTRDLSREIWMRGVCTGFYRTSYGVLCE